MICSYRVNISYRAKQKISTFELWLVKESFLWNILARESKISTRTLAKVLVVRILYIVLLWKKVFLFPLFSVWIALCFKSGFDVYLTLKQKGEIYSRLTNWESCIFASKIDVKFVTWDVKLVCNLGVFLCKTRLIWVVEDKQTP